MSFMTEFSRQNPSEIKDLPEGEHFQILVNESMTYDDGYGEHGRSSMSTMHYLKIIVCQNEEQVTKWIRENDASSYSTKTYRVQHVKPVRVVTQISISLDK